MRRICWLLIGIIITCLTPAQTFALFTYPSGSTGTDVSWPNCNSRQYVLKQSAFGIVGVNDGLDFKGNPCLIQETSWFHNYSLYLSTGYPGDSYGIKFEFAPNYCHRNNSQCLAFNYGYTAADYSLKYASLRNVHATYWWLDVETDNSWTDNPAANVASLREDGECPRTLFVSTDYRFLCLSIAAGQLNRNWQNRLPAWVDSAATKKINAITDCKEQSFNGGPITLTQFTPILDLDYVCPFSSVNN